MLTFGIDFTIPHRKLVYFVAKMFASKVVSIQSNNITIIVVVVVMSEEAEDHAGLPRRANREGSPLWEGLKQRSSKGNLQSCRLEAAIVKRLS